METLCTSPATMSAPQSTMATAHDDGPASGPDRTQANAVLTGAGIDGKQFR